jgi:hypothetical protein
MKLVDRIKSLYFCSPLRMEKKIAPRLLLIIVRSLDDLSWLPVFIYKGSLTQARDREVSMQKTC